MKQEIISPLDEAEKQRLDELKVTIVEGIKLNQKSTMMIIDPLIEIHDSRLYRDFGTFYEWCETFIGLTSRQVNNYLRGNTTTKNVQAVDNTLEGQLPVTFSMLLDKFEPEDQGKLYLEAKDRTEKSGEKLTAKSIAKVARELADAGEIHLRDGVSAPNPDHTPHTPERIKRGWFELTLGDKSEVFNHLVKNETENSLRWMKGMIEQALEQYEPDDNGDDNS